MTDVMLSVNNLTVDYPGRRRSTFRAVDDVSFDIQRGETVGLVGESGSGKTTIARAVQGLLATTAGSIMLQGAPVQARTVQQRRHLASQVQTVFQDPFGSLNPARTVGSTIAESLLAQNAPLTKKETADRVDAELISVGLSPKDAGRLPQEFSGGMCQRIAIARALIARPQLVICDEAVSALDLSIQAQILNLLADLQAERGISYLFITHDLAVVRHVAQRIAVLEHGKMVDLLDAHDDDRSSWSHYTRKLFDAAPIPDPALQKARREQFERTLAEPDTHNAEES